ncbi:MAG: hypothetical protein IKL07_05270 [Clostridium sp.]|nr:hypothetical protein [Clostridium sp.]
MKKINSIGYGGKVIGVGLLFAVVAPIALTILPIPSAQINFLRKGSVIIGGVILGLFTIWLMIEFYQDRKMNGYFLSNRNRMLKISENCYECQACGNRELTADSICCSVCGIKFEEDEKIE